MDDRKQPKEAKTARALARRDALKGLGALAVSLPALATLACGADEQPASEGDVDEAQGERGKSLRDASSSGSSGSDDGNDSDDDDPDESLLDAGSGKDSADARVSTRDSATSRKDAAPSPAESDAGGAADASAELGKDASSGPPASPMFDDAASCTLTTTDIEGPFYIDEGEFPDDPSMIRSDVREDKKGCEFRLHFRMLDASKSCAPIPGAELYIWHCDADGYYSGFSGQDPTKPYMGSAAPTPSNSDRFCRGIQLSDDQGIASFTTLYPGWYAGRPIHIHLMARIKGSTSRLITTQLYFPAAFTTEVHESEPAYMARAAAMPAGSRNPPGGKPAMPTLKHTAGLVVGTLNVIVRRA